MRVARKSSLWILLALVAGLICVGLFFRRQHLKPLTITGAITVQDADPRKQLPLASVEVSLAKKAGQNNEDQNNADETQAKSDSNGFFSLQLPKGLRRGQPLTLMFRHPDYHPID